MRNDSSVPLTHPLRRAAVCVVDGYGVKVCIQRGQLVVEDGLGRHHRRRVYSRATHGLSRIVVLGHQGFVTLDAVRWLADLGIALVHVDRDGRVLASSAVGAGDARLRRLQALAASNETGLRISRMLLCSKLAGQRRLLESLGPTEDVVSGFDASVQALETADSLEQLVFAERDAAIAYWAAWSEVAAHFVRSDERLVPDHWLRFGQRGSPLTSAPRLAINPANALLNYLYALLEAETRLACLTVGLDPGLGIVHVDYRSRDSFVLDLMEAVRPDVDAFVLDLLRSHRFTRRDFGETRRGICRVLAPLSHELSETAPQWGLLIAPTVESVAKHLTTTPGSRVEKVGTPLTGTNRGRMPRRRERRTVRLLEASSIGQPSCKRCHGPVPRRERVYCDDCLPHYQREQFTDAFSGSGLLSIEQKKREGIDPTHKGDAARRRADANIRRKAEVREWDERFGKLTDLSAFKREILPKLQLVPLSELRKATGLSLRYVSLVRRGERVPHPRHWDAFRRSAESGR